MADFVGIGRYVKRYTKNLRKLPPNRKKSPAWRDLTIEEIVERKPKETLSVSSVNRHIGCIKGFMSWCIDEDYIKFNRLTGKTLKEKRRPDKQRDMFTPEDLKKIFAPRKKFFHPYYKWLPLMGLYTGARIEELASLYIEDIKQENGIWYFDINDKKDKRLKNSWSERVIPIHSALIDMEFLKFKDSVKGERLFPELKKFRDKYSHYASKRFSDQVKKLKITGKNKSFHSFRHNFTTQAQNQARLDPVIITHLRGESDGSTMEIYAKRFPVEALKIEIDKIKFDI